MRHCFSLVLGCLSLTLCAGAASAQCEPELLPFIDTAGAWWLTSFQGDLVIAGEMADLHYIARWTGSQWQPFGSDLTGAVRQAIVYDDELYAAGNILNCVRRWDGSKWNVPEGGGLSSGFLEPVVASTLTIYKGELVAGGIFRHAGWAPGVAAQNIAAYDGTTWHALGSGCNKQVICLAVYNDELIMGGEFTEVDGRPMNHIARWDGAAWRPLGTGLDSGVAALAVYRGELYAGGRFMAAGGAPMSLISRFNGVQWTDVGGGLAHTTPFLGALTSLTVFHDELIATGNFKLAGGGPANSIARWTGTEWAAMPGFTTSFPWTTTVLDRELYAGGNTAGLRRYGCPPCTADVNGDGQVDLTDYLDFLNLYDALDPEADLTGDGLVDSADWLAFFDAYAQGCS